MSYNTKIKRYELLCHDMLRDRVVPLDLSVNDIQGEKTIYFDIGSITEVEELREGEVIYPVGYKKIIKEIDRKELKKLLIRKKVNIESFSSNKSIHAYSIIQVDYLNDLKINNKGNLLMSFYSSGKLSRHLIKDYRWLAYKGQLEENEELLKECILLLKNKEREIFLVMHRGENDFVSIVGVHYL